MTRASTVTFPTSAFNSLFLFSAEPSSGTILPYCGSASVDVCEIEPSVLKAKSPGNVKLTTACPPPPESVTV